MRGNNICVYVRVCIFVINEYFHMAIHINPQAVTTVFTQTLLPNVPRSSRPTSKSPNLFVFNPLCSPKWHFWKYGVRLRHTGSVEFVCRCTASMSLKTLEVLLEKVSQTSAEVVVSQEANRDKQAPSLEMPVFFFSFFKERKKTNYSSSWQKWFELLLEGCFTLHTVLSLQSRSSINRILYLTPGN